MKTHGEQEYLEQRAAAGNPTSDRGARVEKLLLVVASPELQSMADRALLRSHAVARWTTDADFVITSAAGGWYADGNNLPVERVLGGRLQAWPVWDACKAAVEALEEDPARRVVSVDFQGYFGKEWRLRVARIPGGWVFENTRQDHHLGRVRLNLTPDGAPRT